MNRLFWRIPRLVVLGIVTSVALPVLAQSVEGDGHRLFVRGHLAPLLFLGDTAEVSSGASGSETQINPGIGADVGLELHVGEGLGLEATLGIYRLDSKTETCLSWGGCSTSQTSHWFVPLDLGVNLYSWKNERSVGYGGAFATWQFGSTDDYDVTFDGEFSWGLQFGTDRRIGDRGNRLSLQLRLRQLVVADLGGSDGVFGISIGIGLGRFL